MEQAWQHPCKWCSCLLGIKSVSTRGDARDWLFNVDRLQMNYYMIDGGTDPVGAGTSVITGVIHMIKVCLLREFFITLTIILFQVQVKYNSITFCNLK